VLNKVDIPKRPEISADDFAAAVEIEPSLILTYEPQIFGTAANNGQMIEEMDKNAKPGKAFEHLARLLTGRAEVARARRSLFSPILGKLSKKKQDKR
jgi:pilus assembly protein CpaE